MQPGFFLCVRRIKKALWPFVFSRSNVSLSQRWMLKCFSDALSTPFFNRRPFYWDHGQSSRCQTWNPINKIGRLSMWICKRHILLVYYSPQRVRDRQRAVWDIETSRISRSYYVDSLTHWATKPLPLPPYLHNKAIFSSWITTEIDGSRNNLRTPLLKTDD